MAIEVVELMRALSDPEVSQGMVVGVTNGITGHVQGIQRISLEKHEGQTYLVLEMTDTTVACHDDGMPEEQRVLV